MESMDTTPFLLWRLPLLTKMMDCYHPSYLGNLIPVPTCNSLDGWVVLGWILIKD